MLVDKSKLYGDNQEQQHTTSGKNLEKIKRKNATVIIF